MERNSKLINKKFIQYLIPSILTIFAMQFTSLLDAILIGNLIGSTALSASSMCVPIIYIVQMPGLALGVGGSIVVGSLLGKRDVDKANKAFSACIIYGIGIAILFAILAPMISRPISNLFSLELREDIYQYVFITLLTDPIIVFALLISSFVSVDNNPRLATIYFIVSDILKISSMFLFIKVFDWGMYGASLSTGFGFLVGAAVLFKYFFSKKRMLKFTFKIKNTFIDLKESLKASGSLAINYLLAAVQLTVINIVISNLITDVVDLAIYGLICNMVFVFDLISGGIVGIIPTLCGIFNGEKDIYSLKSIAKKAYFLNLISSIIITILVFFLPSLYSTIFGFEFVEYQDRANYLVRIFVFAFIPYELNHFSTSYYPSVDKNLPSYITVFLRQLVLVLPLSLFLLYGYGIKGFAIAQVLAEGLTVIITYIFIFIYEHKKNSSKGLFMIEDVNYLSYDFSVDNNIDNASIVSAEISKFCLNNNIDNRSAQMIGLSAEEMISNIILYGYNNRKQSFIDVNLKKIDDTLILRIRDDGMPFNPTEYEINDSLEYTTSGIKLVESITNKMTYMRILNLNNTILEINLGGK
ncbi:MAG: ATP-binding protein [Acholeplasmatales bacterium]|nr:ATP-binding protein [Acholeplasmatales bacterium]